MRRPYGRRHKSLQSAFPSAAALHHRSMDPHQCSHFLPLTRSLRHSANCILCLSIKIYFPFLFSFAFYHLLLIPLLLKSSLSLLARVMRAGLLKWIPSEWNWFANVGWAASNPLEFYTMLHRNVRASVVTQTTHFICMSKSRRRNWTWLWSRVVLKLLSHSELFKKVKTN